MSNRKQEEFATDEEHAALREELIAAGIIKPASEDDQNSREESSTFHPAPKQDRTVNVGAIPESGSYRCRPIRTDEEYDRRRQNYLHVLQSVLRSRRKLGVQFEKERKDR